MITLRIVYKMLLRAFYLQRENFVSPPSFSIRNSEQKRAELVIDHSEAVVMSISTDKSNNS